MAAGDLIDAEVGGIVSGGAGLVRHRGQAVFIRYTAPGDRVRARIVREHRGWAEGELLDLLEPSPHRVSPRCPLCRVPPGKGAPACGGCSLQHLDYQSQLTLKTGILREAFSRLARSPRGGGMPAALAAAETPRALPSPAWEYRNRVQLHGVPAEAGPARVGFKSPMSGRVVPAEDCPVADPGIRSLLAAGELRAPAGRDRFTVYSREGLVLREGGRSRGPVRILDRDLLVDAGVFFQSNAVMLERLVEDLRSLVPRADTSRPLADLYGGVGTFASFLAGSFPRIVLMEENRAALALARKNVGAGGNDFYAMTDNEWVRIQQETRAPGPAEPYGLIIADPPRQGLSPSMRRWLAQGPAPLLAYVSCDPATLARDSGELAGGAWELDDLAYYDFYPQTPHIEALAVFRNRHA